MQPRCWATLIFIIGLLLLLVGFISIYIGLDDICPEVCFSYNLFTLFSVCGGRDIADSLVFGRFILVNKYPEIHEYLTNFFSREIFIMLFPQIMRKTRTQREQTVGSA